MAALTLINVAILIAAGLVVLAALTSLLSLRLGVPLLLVFLCLGLLAGEDGLGQIDFDNAPIAFFVGSVALAIILFDAGFETPWRSFRLAAGPGLTLATIGVVLTAVAVAAIARLLMPLDWPSALMLGAIVSSTDAAAVILLLRLGGIAVRDRVRSTLEIESGCNDPIAVFLTVGLAELASHPGDASLMGLLPSFLLELGIGALGGALGGWAILRLVNRVRLEEGLYPLVVLGSALAIFGGLNALHASGFLGVYVAGLVAGNGQLRGAAGIRRFQSGLTWLSQIGMFLTLGLLATPSEFGAVILPALAIGATLIFVARPLAVWLCLLPFGFGRRETAFVGWVGLRGAVSILLAIIPLLSGNPWGQAIFNTAFLVVLMSLLIQGWSLKPVAARLGQIVPLRQGALERVELALPGEQKMELLAYSVVAGSPVAEGQALPRWARPSLVLRGGNELPPGSEGTLKADDHVFIFAPPERVSLLDRLFAERVKLTGEESEFFGDFPVSADTPLARLAIEYDLILPQQKGGLSLAELFAEQFGEVEVGDRLRVGAVELVVTEHDAGRAKVVGLVLAPAHQSAGLPSLPTGREMAVLLKRWWRHRRQRGRKAARREPTIAPNDRQE